MSTRIRQMMGLQENRDVITSFWNEGYQSVISSLLKLDDVQGAEAIYGEYLDQSEGVELDAEMPGLLISRYCEKGDEMKMREVIDVESTFALALLH